MTAALNNAYHFFPSPGICTSWCGCSCIASTVSPIIAFVSLKTFRYLLWQSNNNTTLKCKTDFCHGYEIIITFFLLHSLKSFFNKARDMVYFKRLIQIPKLPDVREQRVATDYKLVLATHWGSCTERPFFLNLYFYLFIFFYDSNWP